MQLLYVEVQRNKPAPAASQVFITDRAVEAYSREAEQLHVHIAIEPRDEHLVAMPKVVLKEHQCQAAFYAQMRRAAA